MSKYKDSYNYDPSFKFDDYNCVTNYNLKTDIIFTGISKTIEILNEKLEKLNVENEYLRKEELVTIVNCIIQLNREMFKTKDLHKPFLKMEVDDKID